MYLWPVMFYILFFFLNLFMGFQDFFFVQTFFPRQKCLGGMSWVDS